MVRFLSLSKLKALFCKGRANWEGELTVSLRTGVYMFRAGFEQLITKPGSIIEAYTRRTRDPNLQDHWSVYN